MALRVPQYRKDNELHKYAAATCPKREQRYTRDRPSLFAFPAIFRECINTLKESHIGYVEPAMIISPPGGPVIMDIRYFGSLDKVADAEWVGIKNHDGIRYDAYELKVKDIAIIRWLKPYMHSAAPMGDALGVVS